MAASLLFDGVVDDYVGGSSGGEILISSEQRKLFVGVIGLVKIIYISAVGTMMVALR